MVTFTPLAMLEHTIWGELNWSDTLKCSCDSRMIGSLLFNFVRWPILAPLSDDLLVPTVSSGEKNSGDPLSLTYWLLLHASNGDPTVVHIKVNNSPGHTNEAWEKICGLLHSWTSLLLPSHIRVAVYSTASMQKFHHYNIIIPLTNCWP